MCEKIKKWYKMGLWVREQVKAALDKGLITSEQYVDIVGEDGGETAT